MDDLRWRAKKANTTFSFKVSDYNPEYSLMIDPVLAYSIQINRELADLIHSAKNLRDWSKGFT